MSKRGGVDANNYDYKKAQSHTQSQQEAIRGNTGSGVMINTNQEQN